MCGDMAKAVGGSRLGAAIFMLAGAVALAIGVWQGVQTWRFLARAVPATGHVVAAPGQVGPMASAHPTLEFAGPGGIVVRYRQNGMGARPVGTPVDLLYDPAAPADTAVVRGFWTQWFPVLGPILLGLGLLSMPLLGVEIALRGARP